MKTNLPLVRPLLGRFGKLNLKQKITLFVALLLFLTVCTVGFYSYFISVNQVVAKVIESQSGLVRQVANNLDQLLNDAQDISSLIIIDPNIQEILLKHSPIIQTILLKNQNEESFLNYTNSIGFLDKIMATKSFISMITLYGNNGLNYSIGTDFTGSNVVPFAQFKQHPIYQKAMKLNGSIGMEYFTNHPELVYDNRSMSRIVMYRAIKEFRNYQKIGVLLIWLNEQKIRSIYQPNVPAGGIIMVIDRKGTVVSSSDSYSLQTIFLDGYPFKKLLKTRSGSESVKLDGREMLLTYGTSAITGWKIVALTPRAVLTEKINSIGLVILLVGVVCYILMLVFSNFITAMITNPLQQLLSSIKKVQSGDFSQQVGFTGSDEIGELGRGYNAMIDHIRDLIERVYKLQIKEKEAELKALQAQINPHFLYNTLDTIFWKANKYQIPEISEMVYALSRIFRLSLNRGQELTTVAQEQELIRHYLALQQIRFKEKLQVTLEIDPQLQEMTIPKLILQPFVENAIIHGIESQADGGWIVLRGRLENAGEGGEMVFEIRDDGIGMSAATIDRILTKAEPETANPTPVTGGYAIHNVIERLELYYNATYHLSFESSPGAGTTITIRIPCRMNTTGDPTNS